MFTVRTIFVFALFIFSLFLVSTVSASEVTNSWTSTTSLPQTRASLASIGESGNLYIFGGATTDDYASIFRSSQNVDGTISSWDSAGDLPETRYWMASAKNENRIYILGGAKFDGGETHKNTVYSATILPDGTISPWQTFNSLPAARSLGAAAILNDRIYFAGGFNNGGYSNKVYSAPINPDDGSLGAWAQVGVMPQNRIGLGMIEHNGHLLILGGDSGGGPINTVYKTTPDESGSISSWQPLNLLPGAVYRGGWVKVGDILMSVGGQGFSGSTDNIYYTTLNTDGTVGDWHESVNHLPIKIHGGHASILGNYLYYFGGFQSQTNSYHSSVFFAKLNLETDLNVPLLKQTDPTWGAQIYDKANLWQPNDPGIDASGCALTSATMVFLYHGLSKLPDGTSIDPGTLNTWLKENRGYVGGYVSWSRLSDLSELAKSQNPSFIFNSLEFQRINGYNPTQLKEDLENNIPGILGVPGHFIVGKGILGNSFSINDPFYNRTSLNDYSNTFSSLGRFIPSNSDVSYIELAIDDGVNLSVKNENGSAVGEGFTQEPYTVEGVESTNLPLYFYLVAKPDNGKYEINVISETPKEYNLVIRLHDEDGNLIEKTIEGIALPVNKDIFTINFNKVENSESNIIQSVTFDSLISDLDYFYDNSAFKNYGGYNSLRVKLIQAKKLFNKGKLADAKVILLEFIEELEVGKGETISEEAYLIIKPQASALYNSL